MYKTEKGQEKQTMLVNAKRTTEEIVAKSNESRKKGECPFIFVRKLVVFGTQDYLLIFDNSSVCFL